MTPKNHPATGGFLFGSGILPSMVAMTGVEPARAEAQSDDSAPRIPFRHMAPCLAVCAHDYLIPIIPLALEAWKC